MYFQESLVNGYGGKNIKEILFHLYTRQYEKMLIPARFIIRKNKTS